MKKYDRVIEDIKLLFYGDPQEMEESADRLVKDKNKNISKFILEELSLINDPAKSLLSLRLLSKACQKPSAVPRLICHDKKLNSHNTELNHYIMQLQRWPYQMVLDDLFSPSKDIAQAAANSIARSPNNKTIKNLLKRLKRSNSQHALNILNLLAEESNKTKSKPRLIPKLEGMDDPLKYYQYYIRYLNLSSIKLQHEKRSREMNPIVVYQMGKVGSMSVYKSLQDLKYFSQIYHCHRLSEHHRMGLYTKSVKQAGKTGVAFVRNLAKIDFLRAQICHAQDKKMKIITLVRDPVLRGFSSFFQKLDRVADENLITSNLDDYKETSLIRYFTESFLFFCMRSDDWFMDELNDVFGINVYEHSFDVEKGYQIIESQLADVLIIRLENLNSCFQKAVQEFIGIKNCTLRVANTSEEKPYRTLYNILKERVKLSNTSMNRILNMNWVLHFYSEQEINIMRDKWTLDI